MPVSKNKKPKSKMNSFGLRKAERRRKENEEMRNRHISKRSNDYGLARAISPIMSLVAFSQQARRRKAKREQQESTISSDDNVKEATDENSSES